MQPNRRQNGFSPSLIAGLVREYPGSTCAELSAASGILPQVLSEALCHTRDTLHSIRKGEPKICTINSRLSETWHPVS
ncbi:hypothetical protein GCM10023116_15600 [Kistimonas scapharcae]|uniref:Uncharacterized protein n=1 Tax=Kistimonas scapharcae TaxID=1036133 RepID=A0ABP8V053_9GAMM